MKENNILVSVVLPVYNVEKYLPKCLDTVINQSYKNLEILLVDDGATDSSGNICEQYAKKDNRIKVLHKKNGGLSDARNYALDYIHGEYIAFIDSDDYVNERYIEVLLRNAINYDADISICDYKTVKEEVTKPLNCIEENKTSVYTQEEAMLQILHGSYIMQFSVAWGKIYKRIIFNELRYPFGRKFEDVAVAHLCFNLTDKTVYSNSQLYYYLIRSGSIKNSGKFKDADVVKSAYDRLLFFKDYENGKYYIECKRQYMTSIMGTYARFSEATVELKKAKNELYSTFRNYYNKNKREVMGINVFSIRCILFLLTPHLYSRLVLFIK